MKKTLIIVSVLIALSIALAGCSSESSDSPTGGGETGSDWRTWGIIDGYGTLNTDGEELDVCVCLFGNRAELYYDQASQSLYKTIEYPSKLTEEQYSSSRIEFADCNGDGNTDIQVFAEGGEGIHMTWLYGSGEFVYSEEYSGPSAQE